MRQKFARGLGRAALVLVYATAIAAVFIVFPTRTIGLSLLYLSTIIAALSVVLYQVLHPGWRRSSDGWHVMTYMGAVALILVVWSAGALFSVPPWWEQLRLASFAFLPVALAHRLWLIIRTFVERRKARRSVPEQEPA